MLNLRQRKENQAMLRRLAEDPAADLHFEFYGFVRRVAISLKGHVRPDVAGNPVEADLLERIEKYMYYFSGAEAFSPSECYIHPTGADRSLYVNQRAACIYTQRMHQVTREKANQIVNAHGRVNQQKDTLEISGYQKRLLRQDEFYAVLTRVSDIINEVWQDTPHRDFKEFFLKRRINRESGINAWHPGFIA